MKTTSTQLRYAMELLWEPEGKVFVVTIPEFRGCKTHGETYVEAVTQGVEVMELCHDVDQEMDRQTPSPFRYGDSSVLSDLDTNDIEQISPMHVSAVTPPYSLMIQWDGPEQSFIAHVPELKFVAARGNSYEDAAAGVQDAITSKVYEMRSRGEPLPRVNTYSLSLVAVSA